MVFRVLEQLVVEWSRKRLTRFFDDFVSLLSKKFRVASQLLSRLQVPFIEEKGKQDNQRYQEVGHPILRFIQIIRIVSTIRIYLKAAIIMIG